MRELEEQATREFNEAAMFLAMGDPHVTIPKELVALGIVDAPSGAAADLEDMGDVAVTWFAMPNKAEHPREDGRGEFFVEGTDIWDTLVQAAGQLGYLKIGADTRRCIDRLLLDRVVILWHTHLATTDPSQADIEEFPVWLADYGMVFHVPSGATTVYNQSGVISSTKSAVLLPESTKDVGRDG